MKNIIAILIICILLSSCSTSSGHRAELTVNGEALERVQQQLVSPPGVPEHRQIALGNPKIVEVTLVAEEKEIDIGGGANVHAMTFNGSVPGPLIVVHQNDFVELTLENPETNQLSHTIDFHAATGALGGAKLAMVESGEAVKIRFQATKPGVFVYHCAPGGAMIPYHVISGMNGAIMVLPRDGLKDQNGNPVSYDKAYYIGEQDFYVPQDENGMYTHYDSAEMAMQDVFQKAKTLTPSHVVFNGAVGALTGDNALQAEVGEKVLFIHSQANRDSRPHLIGGHGDLVWEGGSFSDVPKTNLETWYVPGGSAVAALYEFKQPGLYVYVNHNLIEAVMLGAAAHMMVEGEWDDQLMTQIAVPYALKQQQYNIAGSN